MAYDLLFVYLYCKIFSLTNPIFYYEKVHQFISSSVHKQFFAIFLVLFTCTKMTAQVTEQIPSNFIMIDDSDKVGNNGNNSNTPINCNTSDANNCPWDNQPIKYLAVNFHYFCKPDGKGNFNENNDGDTPPDNAVNAYIRAEEILKEANEQLRENSPRLNAPSGNSVCKINLQLTLKGVYVHRGSFEPDVLEYDSATDKHTMNTDNSWSNVYFNSPYAVNSNSEINCYFYPFVKAANVTKETFSSGYTNLGNNILVVSGGWESYKAMYKDKGDKDTWYTKIDARTLIHEILHDLGVEHPKDPDECSDTKNDLDCWQWVDNPESPCNKLDKQSNNIMDYNGDVNTWAMSPCQICIAQQAMEGTGYDMKKYVSFVGTCQKPVALFYGPLSYCFSTPMPVGFKPSVIIDGTATTYEKSYELKVVEINTSTNQAIPSTLKSKWFSGEIGKVNLTKVLDYTFKVGKSYKITLRTDNTCSEPDIVNKIIKITSCNEPSGVGDELRRVLVYPNPVLETINIEYELGQPQNIKIDLINLVTEYTYPLKTSSNETEGSHYFSIETPHWITNGNYAIKISTANQVVTQSIFIQH